MCLAAIVFFELLSEPPVSIRRRRSSALCLSTVKAGANGSAVVKVLEVAVYVVASYFFFHNFETDSLSSQYEKTIFLSKQSTPLEQIRLEANTADPKFPSGNRPPEQTIIFPWGNCRLPKYELKHLYT